MKTQSRTARQRTHSFFFAVTGIRYVADCERNWYRLGTGHSAYVGDGVWVRPDGTTYTDKPIVTK